MGSILQCRHLFGLGLLRVSNNGIKGSSFIYLWKMILSTITEPMNTPIVATTASIMYIQIIYFHPLAWAAWSLQAILYLLKIDLETTATRRTVSSWHISVSLRSLYIYTDDSSANKSNEMGNYYSVFTVNLLAFHESLLSVSFHNQCNF